MCQHPWISGRMAAKIAACLLLGAALTGCGLHRITAPNGATVTTWNLGDNSIRVGDWQTMPVDSASAALAAKAVFTGGWWW